MRTPNDKKKILSANNQLLDAIHSPAKLEDRERATYSAIKLVDEYLAAINTVLKNYTDYSNQPISSLNRTCAYELHRLFQSESSSRFTKFFDTHESTWRSLAPLIEKITKDYDLHLPIYDEHSLALLLRPDNEAFLENVTLGKLALGEEIGILAIERMKSMFSLATTTPKQKSSISRAIKSAVVNPQLKEGIFNFNYQALVFEVTKLYLHDFLQREKVIWLGTAKAVNAFERKTSPEKGICLGCPEKEYSWGLNRAWLHCAAVLGYQFQPIEQHFPFIEEAIIRSDSVGLISQLAREIRKHDQRSQYTRGDSPTATPQEILFLLSLGFRGEKKEDGTLLFTKDDYLGNKLSCPAHRSHSAPIFYSKKPPATVYSTLSEILETPSDGSSPDYRNSPTSPDIPQESGETDETELQRSYDARRREVPYYPPPPPLLSPAKKMGF